MPCLQKLIIATDGFASGERALTCAIALAAQRHSELIVVCSVDPGSQIAGLSIPEVEGEMFAPRVGELEDAALALLAAATNRARAADVHSRSMVLMGPPIRTIVDFANRERVDAIVLGTEAKTGLGRFCMGSTAEGVIRRASVPVVVVSPSISTARPSFARILVAVDDSDASDAAMSFAVALAVDYGATLVLCAVADTDDVLVEGARYGESALDNREELRIAAHATLNRSGARSMAAGVPCELRVVEGFAAEQLLIEALRSEVGLIVIGTHGSKGFGRMLLGSVAESVARDSTIPVAVVRDPSRIAEHERAKTILLPEPF